MNIMLRCWAASMILLISIRYWNSVGSSIVVRHRRCVETSRRWTTIETQGRDNRKSAAAGAKDGQFSGGFVTRESLHGGQWPHPSSPPTPPVYISSRVSPAKLPSLPHVERLQLQTRPTVLHKIVAYAWTLSDKATSFPRSQMETDLVCSFAFFFFFSFSFYLARVHSVPCPTPRKCFEVRKVSERLNLPVGRAAAELRLRAREEMPTES